MITELEFVNNIIDKNNEDDHLQIKFKQIYQYFDEYQRLFTS